MILSQTEKRTLESLVKLGRDATFEDLPHGARSLTALVGRGFISIDIRVTRHALQVMDSIAHQRNLASQHRRRVALREGKR